MPGSGAAANRPAFPGYNAGASLKPPEIGAALGDVRDQHGLPGVALASWPRALSAYFVFMVSISAVYCHGASVHETPGRERGTH